LTVSQLDIGFAQDPMALDEVVLDLMPAAVCVCAADGTILRFNRRAVALWGRVPQLDGEERFCGAERVLTPEGRPIGLDETPMAEAIRTRRAVSDRELVVVRPDASRLHVIANVEPVFARSGRFAGAIACFHDISARIGSERRLREAEEHLRAVIEATPECVKVVARDGTLLQINPAGLAAVEADAPEQVAGSSVFAIVAPEHRDAWRACHARVCDGESLTWEFEIVGLRGRRRHLQTHAVPLSLPDGSTAQLSVTRDITESHAQEERLRDSERRLRELLQALPAAIYTTDAEGRITFFNEAAAELWGVRPEIGQTQWCGSWRMSWPDGTPLPLDQCPMARSLKESRPVRDVEAFVERPDGTRVAVLPYPTPLRDPDGRLVGAVNMLVDISRHKDAERHQRLLINELNHRVKNTLATVQSVAAQSFRGAAESAAFRSFEGRLVALAKAHDVLTRESWESADIGDVVGEAISAHRSDEADRFDVSGPSVRLAPQLALSLAMAVHELCTNAAKYGALSNAEGRVTIGWTKRTDRGRERLTFRWSESGGPPLVPPPRRGFGTRLIERGLAEELSAEVRLDFAPDGLRYEVDTEL
jgi:PAS domain S-box-containing protein